MATAQKSPGLIPVPKEVSRAGKTFTQTYWMKSEEAAKIAEKAGFNPSKAGAQVGIFKDLVDQFAGFKGAGNIAASFSSNWTSSCKNASSAAAQGIVAALLGRDPKQTAHVMHGDPNVSSLLAANKKAQDPDDQARKAMIGCYAATQAALKLAGEPETMKLSRGVSGPQATQIVAAAKALADAGVHYDDAAVVTAFNPLSCFTRQDSISYGSNFGGGSKGLVFSLDVPREAVMFSHKSTPGHSTSYEYEKEYTVMCAGSMDLALRNVHGGAGKEIYDYFAARGLTGEQTPKAVGPKAPPPDPLISFKVQGKLAPEEMQKAVEASGGTWKGGGGTNVELKASQVAGFVDAFSKTPAFDAKVNTKEAMSSWLGSKATQAIDDATPGKLKHTGGEGWKAPEPESKDVAERIAKALGAGGAVSAALKAKAAQLGAAAEAAAPKADEEDLAEAHFEDLHNKMNSLIPDTATVFGKPSDLMNAEEHAINDAAHDKATEELMASEDPKEAATAYKAHIAKHLPALKAAQAAQPAPYKAPAWAKPSEEKFKSASATAQAVHWAVQNGYGKSNADMTHTVPPSLVTAAVKAIAAHPKLSTMTSNEAHTIAQEAFTKASKALKTTPALEKPASSKAMKPSDVEAAKPPHKLAAWAEPSESKKMDQANAGKYVDAWVGHHHGVDTVSGKGAEASDLGKAAAAVFSHPKFVTGTMTEKEGHEVAMAAIGAGKETKIPDAPAAKVEQFFKDNAGKQPPHRKWYWEGWAQAAMNKAGIPKEQHKEIFEKVQAQAKVMLAKHTLSGQKVSQEAAKAYIQAQAIKKGESPDMMPHVAPTGEKPPLEKKTHAEAKEIHAYLQKKAAHGNATAEEQEALKADPEDVHALKKSMKAIGIDVEAPPKVKAPGAGPEHPYEYYWKTWANKAAKEETGKPAPEDVHSKISGLAKKFIAQKTLAGAKFTGKDLEKYIQAAAKKQGEHPGDI